MTATLETLSAVVDSPMPLERVEARLVELSSQIAGATCELLCLVAQFDAADGGKVWGLASTAHWLSWKCGVGMTAAREQVRVARKLVGFPALITEFSAGRLSYSKVRSITRAATENTIDTWIMWARHSTAAQLDRIVAGCQRARRSRDAQAQRATRQVSYRWDEDGTLVGSFRLPPEDGARLIVALEAARAVLPDPVAEAEAVEDEAAPACAKCVCASAEIHAQAPCELIGAHDCDEMAANHARAVCSETSAEALNDHRPRKSMADALTFLAERTIDWVAAHADPDAELGLPGLGKERFQLVIHASAEASAASGASTDLFDAAQVENGPALHPETARRLACACPWSVQIDDPRGNPLHLGRKARRARGRLARAVHHRDHGHCQAPGCTNRTTEIHHIVYWSDQGPTCITNLISLCSSHHWLVHEGGWIIITLAPGSWLFQRADGSPVPRLTGAPVNLEPLPADRAIIADAIAGHWDRDASIDDAVWLMATLDEEHESRDRAGEVVVSA